MKINIDPNNIYRERTRGMTITDTFVCGSCKGFCTITGRKLCGGLWLCKNCAAKKVTSRPAATPLQKNDI